MKTRGFSLVEVMVVVAVLAALFLLSLPLLGRVRSASRESRCASNLKTIGTAVAAHAADHGGAFPPSRLQFQMKNGVKATVPFLPDRLNEYLELEDVTQLWWCPGDTERPVQMRKHSYGHNQRLGGEYANQTLWDGQINPQYDPRYGKFQSVTVPLSQVIYLIDYVDKGDAGKWSSAVTSGAWPLPKGSLKATPPQRRIDFERHPPGANALFLDGSVRSLKFEDLVGTVNKHIAPF